MKRHRSWRPTMIRRMLRTFLMVLAVVGVAFPGEWTAAITVAPGAEQVWRLEPAEDWRSFGALTMTWESSHRTTTDAWAELCLVTADDRFFSNATPLAIAGDLRRAVVAVPLASADWASDTGILDENTLATVREIRLRLHPGRDGAQRPLNIVLRLEPGRSSDAEPVVQMIIPGRIARGGWHELRLRLARRDACDAVSGEVDLVAADDRAWPLFLDQPWHADAVGRWHAHGGPYWVLRLRPDEHPAAPARLRWKTTAKTWMSAPFTLPDRVVATDEILPPPRPSLPVPASLAWTGPWAVARGDGFIRQPSTSFPPGPAPTLVWRLGWGGFRGTRGTAWPQAAAIDALAAAGCASVDLLPQWLAEEHGAFRFGTSPWASGQGGPLRHPLELWQDDALLAAWKIQARELIARMRASPGLGGWRLGLTQSAHDDAQVQRLRRFLTSLVGLVAASDGRPCTILHPQAVDYRKPEPAKNGAWFGFEDHLQGWRASALSALGGGRNRLQTSTAFASQGRSSLEIPFPVSGALRTAGVEVPLDRNLFNLDRLEFDALAHTGDGAVVQLYLWVTDQHHRWFQQRLCAVAGGDRWQTVLADFSDGAAWESVGHSEPWGAAVRRRVRALGISAFCHATGAAVAKPASLFIDRVRRSGWPVESAVSTLRILDLRADGTETGSPPATLARWSPVSASFQLTGQPLNPYDPDCADVVGEIEGPDGAKRRHPAWWEEPYRLEIAKGEERPILAGPGCWRWKFTPTVPGTWRYRIVARLKERDEWKTTESPWRSVAVTTGQAGHFPIPVRICRTDPLWWETAEGAWWYPLGINLRSPGDERQDDLIAEALRRRRDDVQDFPFTASADWERLGTGAYARWFAQMHKAGMNWGRVWMSPWWCGQEWAREWDDFGGLTWYSQQQSARLDRVLDLAAAQGVYLQIELQNHGMTSPSIRSNGQGGVDTQWDPSGRNPGSPYNRVNGGPCDHPSEFFSRDEVWQIHAKRLRYINARWGWRTGIAAWVLSSEMEFTGAWDIEAALDEFEGHSPTTQRWVDRSLAWFKQEDPLQRPVSIHFSHPWRAKQLWRTPGLGFSNSNAYTAFQSEMGNRFGGGQRELGRAFTYYLENCFPAWELKRPTLIGEWGGRWVNNGQSELSAELRTGLWMQACLPFGGNTGFWWYLWVDAADRWRDYAAVARFLTDEDRRGKGYRMAQPTWQAGTGNGAGTLHGKGSVSVLGMAGPNNHRYYAWIAGSDQRLPQRPLTDGGTLEATTGAPGSSWQCERWDCGTGTRAQTTTVTADARGTVRLPLGTLNPDVAFKLDRLDTDAATPPGRSETMTPPTPAATPAPRSRPLGR